MEFHMAFKMDNASFDGKRYDKMMEMVKLFDRAMQAFFGGDNEGNLMDSNGNRIGGWKIKNVNKLLI